MSLAACMPPLRVGHGAPGGPGPGFSSHSAGAVRAHGSTATVGVLDRTPVEVLVDVFQRLDIRSALSLAATNKRFARIYASHRVPIVLGIVKEEFSPLDGLLQVVKASPADLSVPWGTWLDKRVRRKNNILCPGGRLPEHCPDRTAAMKIECAEAHFQDADIDRVLSVCRVVRGWERVFPQHRFTSAPLMTRSLTARENVRLRRAIYHWMRYAYYFHGDLPRPNHYIPAGRDVRVNQLRALSNSELSELRDLWSTVDDIVRLTLCPSVELVQRNSDFDIAERDAERIGWGRAFENRAIVATLCKLSPAELLHYLDNGHKYSKVQLLRDVRLRHPHFQQDTESLTSALSCVAEERWRHMLPLCPALSQPVSLRPRQGEAGDAVRFCDSLEQPLRLREDGKYDGGILDWNDAGVDALLARVGEMTGLWVNWRPDKSMFGRREMLPGSLNV